MVLLLVNSGLVPYARTLCFLCCGTADEPALLSPPLCLLQDAVHKFIRDLKSKPCQVISDNLHVVGVPCRVPTYLRIIMCVSQECSGSRAAHP